MFMKNLSRKIICFVLIITMCIPITYTQVSADEDDLCCGIIPPAIDNEILQGEEFDFTADLLHAETNAGVTRYHPIEFPTKCEWTVFSNDGGDASDIQLSGSNEKICTVKVSKTATVGKEYTIQLKGYYLGWDGTYKQINEPSTYSFKVVGEKYYVDADIPEYLNTGESVTFKPVIKRKTCNNEEIVEEAMENMQVINNYEDYFKLTDNGNGTYTVTKISDTSAGEYITVFSYFHVIDAEGWEHIKDVYGDFCFNNEEPEYMFFIENGQDYDFNSDMQLVVSKEKLDTDCDEFKLYVVEDGNDTEINKSDYEVQNSKYTVSYSISKEWVKDHGNGKERILFKCVALKNGKAITDCIDYVYLNKIRDIDIHDSSIVKNRDYMFNSNGKLYLYYKSNFTDSCVYFVDAVESSDNNILKINKDDNGWKYRGIAKGNARLTVKYHYYEDGKRFTDEKTVAISVTDDYDNTDAGDEENLIIEKSQNISLIDHVFEDNTNKIRLNIYWHIDSEHDYKHEESYYLDYIVKVSKEGDKEGDRYYTLSKNTYNTFDFYTTVDVNIGELSKNMKIQLISNHGKVVDEFTTSLESYIEKLLSSNEAGHEKYKPMALALLNYSAASQKYFGVNTDNLANKNLAESQKTVESIPTYQLYKYNETKTLNVDGLHYYGTSLVIQNSIKIRHYFTVDDDRQISNYEFTAIVNYIPGYSISEFTPSPNKSGNMYYIELDTDGNHFFDKTSLAVCNGGISYDRFFYSPMNYISNAYLKGNIDDNLKQLLNSMYWFEYQKSELSNEVS